MKTDSATQIIKKQNTFSRNLIKQILLDVKGTIRTNNSILLDAINYDYKNEGFKCNLPKISSIVSEICSEPILMTGNISGKTIIDGYGSIGIVYNGSPEVTLTTLLVALKTHNNIILFSDNNLKTNTVLVELFLQVLKKNNYNCNIILENNTYSSIISYENMLDKILFIGNKYEYVKLRKSINIPIEYNGYGYISIISETNNDLIENIRMFCLNNYINLELYIENFEDAFIKVNELRINQTVVIFSNNKKDIINATIKIKTSELYINKNPLVNYKFKIDQKSFLTKKTIIS